MFLCWNSGSLDSVNDTSKNNGTSSLDVVVEASVSRAISLKSWEWVLEVLKLDDDTVVELVDFKAILRHRRVSKHTLAIFQ